MAKFSSYSMNNLNTCRLDLQRVLHVVVKNFDCRVTCGRRGREEQEQAFNDGTSKAHYGQSPHNYEESFAVDVTPYPVDYDDRERQALFAGYMLATAAAMGIELKWGGDWDRDTHLSDNRFDDFPHFELVGWRELAQKDLT